MTPTGRFRKIKTKSPGSKKRHLLKDGSVPEKYIQRSILDWLKTTELLYWRQNSGHIGLGFRRVELGPDGAPDIIVIVPPSGRILGLEVKSASGSLRPSQKAFRERLETSGGIFRVVRSLEEAKDTVAGVLGGETLRYNGFGSTDLYT